MSCRVSCCLSQLESNVRPISLLFSPPWQSWRHFSIHECVSCIHEAFWHHSLFCYELDHGSALLSAAIWCSGKRLSKGKRDWGREKKEIELRQMKLIYFQSKRGKWLWLVERGGMPWNIKPSPEQASRLFRWQPCCACSLGTALENKHTHFCYLSNVIWERLIASAMDLSNFISVCNFTFFGEQNLSAPPCVHNCQVLVWQC